jgi:hypothetical protein
MKLNPDTKICSLLVAIPSSVIALGKLGIPIDGNEEKTLQQVCLEREMKFQEILRAMDEIDWDKETPQHHNPSAP